MFTSISTKADVSTTYTKTETDTLLNAKENVSNKTDTISSYSTTAQYPSAYATHNAIEDVREVAMGKTASYVCSATTNPVLNSQSDSVELIENLVDINERTISLSSLKLGDNVYITQTDVPDRWVASEFGGRIPSIYQEVEWIGTDGNQYILTNIYPSYTYGIKATFIVDEVGGERSLSTTIGSGRFGLNMSGYNWQAMSICGSTYHSGTNHVLSNTTYNIEYNINNNRSLYVNSILEVDNLPQTNRTLSQPMPIFACNATGSIIYRAKIKQLSNFEVYNNNIVIAKFIPCYRKSDIEIGLYDLINGVFYTNQGTGTFTKGNDVQGNVSLSKLETAKVPVTDVQINGTTIVNNSIANIPFTTIMNQRSFGVSSVTYGKYLVSHPANYSEITKRRSVNPGSGLNVNERCQIVPANLNFAVKSALSDANRINDMTDTEKQNAWGVLSIIKTSMDSIAVPNAQYYLGEQSSVSFTLPSATAGQSISVVFYSGATATTLSISGTMLGTIPAPVANTRYELNILYDGTNWALLSNAMGTN